MPLILQPNYFHEVSQEEKNGCFIWVSGGNKWKHEKFGPKT